MKAKFGFIFGHFAALLLFAFFSLLTGLETEKAGPIIIMMLILGVLGFAYIYIKDMMDESLK